MDYAKAVKGYTSYSKNIKIVESQAELELSRNLTKLEKNHLSNVDSPAALVNKMKKVGQYY